MLNKVRIFFDRKYVTLRGQGIYANIYTQCSRLTVVKTVTKFRKVLSSLSDVKYRHQHINTPVKSITLRLYTTFVNEGIKNSYAMFCECIIAFLTKQISIDIDRGRS